jgi:hypothetical protein
MIMPIAQDRPVKKEAVPCLFPYLPNYLSKNVKKLKYRLLLYAINYRRSNNAKNKLNKLQLMKNLLKPLMMMMMTK